MTKRTSFNCAPTIVILAATYLLCLTLDTAHSSPAEAKLDGQAAKQPVVVVPRSPAAGEIRRISTPERAAGKLVANSGAASSSKFQARMMRADQQQQQQPQQQQQQSIQAQQQQDSYYMGSDNWNPHSLVPTFTDQEQGDEMVALASDSEPEQQTKVPAPGNRSSPSGDSTTLKQRGEHPESSAPMAASGKSQRGSHQVASKQSVQPTDEYYPDEDEDDDPEPSKPMRGEFSESISEDRKQTSSPKQFRQSMQQQQQAADSPYGDYDPAAFNDGYRLRQKEPSVASRPIKLSQATESGWLPSSGSIGAPDRAYATSQAAAASVAAATASIQQTKTQLGATVQQQQQPQRGASEKLAELFGGRESVGPFSKADVAIEYLRNILNNKQSSLGAHNSTATDGSGSSLSANSYGKHQSDLMPGKSINLHRLSSIASRLNQILNGTSTFGAANQSQTMPPKLEPAGAPYPFEAKKALDVQQFVGAMGAPQVDTIGTGKPGSLLNQQTDAKFSIGDAKPTSTMDMLFQTQAYASSTTKLPAGAEEEEQRPVSRPAQQSAANGTPVGGDYIESLDDFPRGLRLQQQQQQQQTAQPAVAQQSTSQIGELPAVSNRQIQAAHQAAHMNQMSQFHQGAYGDEFAAQPQQTGGPTSTRFFHMQQPSSGYMLTEGSTQIHATIDNPKSAFAAANADQAKQQQQQQQYKVVDSQQAPTVQMGLSSNRTTEPIEAKKPNDVKQFQPQTPAAGQPKQTQASLISEPQLAPSRHHQHQHKYHQHQQQQQQHHHQQQHHQQQHQHQQQQISSKLYKNEPAIYSQTQSAQPLPPQHQPAASKPMEQPMFAPPKVKSPPKIVSYNYFGGPSELGDGELMATNYQLGDVLYSSNGGIEQTLTNAELEAIQSQFMTAEHPVMPVPNEQAAYGQQPSPFSAYSQDSNLAGLLASLKSGSLASPETLQKLSSPAKQAEEALKELASNEETMSVAPPLPPPSSYNNPRDQRAERTGGQQPLRRPPIGRFAEPEAKKKKSLIVYLNHPRPTDMPKASASPNENFSLAQTLGEQPADAFISAKEFDSHGLSKDNKFLDISKGQDKDGLSVVVIGDAYKYKKIVLLISSKSGGLKFIPMVKDMK